jgi:MFS family permease
VIAAGAILGVGASFLWVTQGAIMTTYVPENQKGRAIAVFWIIFNFGGGVGSLASFGLNYNSKSGTVSNATYIALMVIMAFGWFLGIFICAPSKVRMSELRESGEKEHLSFRDEVKLSIRTITNWRVACMLPLFFCANIFYSYQQNNVNGYTFNIRTRSLNSALYWMAQMAGGLVMGALLDLKGLSRKHRGMLGWAVLFVTGMAIWGGGYAFEKWEDVRLAHKQKQDIDYLDASISTGPIFLYIFYGCYDALWQSFSYWMIGSVSNSAAVAAVLVGAYKSFQATGAAVAWRINALAYPGMTQLAIDWGLCIGSLVIIIPTVLTITATNVETGEDLVDKAREE